jgi:3-hydroxybutyrate dehydrogenase
VIAINLTAPFHMMRLAIPYMKNNKNSWGRIINISSVHGIVASINKAAYVSAKHGLNGLTKVAALENASDTQITVNAICPGWVKTPLVERQIEVYHIQSSRLTLS